MESFHDEDGSGGGQVVLVGDQRCSREVGRGADTLKNGGECDEGYNIRVWESVSASLNWGCTCGRDGGR